VLSLLVVGVGIVVTASFFVVSPQHDAKAEVAVAEKRSTATEKPWLPVAAGKIDRQKRETQRKDSGGAVARKRVVSRGPESKMLRMTIPKMAQIRNDTVPYSVSDDNKAFRKHAAVHLRGTGNPWDRQANVYIAGHRLGFPNTESWLTFWDMNKVNVGDEVFVTDADGTRYTYKVFKEFTVGPSDTSVTTTQPGKNILTLQTCTLPDYSQRLIIQAELTDTSEKAA
jgi:sortase A